MYLLVQRTFILAWSRYFLLHWIKQQIWLVSKFIILSAGTINFMKLTSPAANLWALFKSCIYFIYFHIFVCQHTSYKNKMFYDASIASSKTIIIMCDNYKEHLIWKSRKAVLNCLAKAWRDVAKPRINDSPFVHPFAPACWIGFEPKGGPVSA